MQMSTLYDRKLKPDLCKGKAPRVASPEGHQLLSGVFCNMAGTVNDVVYDIADPAAPYPPLWVGPMPKGLLPNHTK